MVIHPGGITEILELSLARAMPRQTGNVPHGLWMSIGSFQQNSPLGVIMKSRGIFNA
jgi:hypothetical protein